MVVSTPENSGILAPTVACLENWRTAPAVRGASASNSVRLVLPDESRYITSLAVSNVHIRVSSCLVTGSGGREGSLHFVQVPDPPELSEFQLVKTVPSPGPVYALAWSGRTLLSGSSDGTTHVCTVDIAQLTADSMADSKDMLTYTDQAVLRASRSAGSSVGTFTPTQRVQGVQFAPTVDPTSSSEQFAAIVGHSIGLWDLQRLGTPVRTDKVASDVNLTMSWHPQPAQQLIAVGGVDKSISLLDPRKQGKPVVWKSRHVHDEAIQSIAWHPYIPYWFASASDDNRVQVYDIRFSTRPLYAIDEHYGGVVWSNAHCDLLASACSDRRFRLWRLRSEKTDTGSREVTVEQTIGSSPLFDSAVVQAVSSNIIPDTYYAVSTLGELRSFSMSQELLHMSTMHRYDEKDYPLEFSIETSVYARDLDAGHRQVASWIKRPGNDQRMQEAKTFLELLTVKPAIEAGSWTLSPSSSTRQQTGAAEAAESFPRELARRAWFLPPGFDMRLAIAPSNDAKRELEMMLVKINLRDYIQKGDINMLKSLESSILQMLAADPRSLDSNVLKDMLKVVMKSDRVHGLEFGLALVESRTARTTTLASVVHLLLFPTVYDSVGSGEELNSPTVMSPRESMQSQDGAKRAAKRDERRNAQRQMEDVVGDTKQVAAMIRLEIELLRAKQRGNGSLQADELVHLAAGQRTVSATTNRLYLNARVDLGHYDIYFEEALMLITEYARFEFARSLLHQLAMVVAPKCKQELEHIVATGQSNPRAIPIRDFRRMAVLCMRTIVLPGSEIPGLGRQLLATYLVDILAGLQDMLQILINERKDYSQAVREAQQVTRAVKEAAGSTHQIPEEVHRRLDALQEFTRI